MSATGICGLGASLQATPTVGDADYSADVLVVGGGPAGVCAAISAARNGAKTLLVEQSGMLGGMATQGLV